MGSESRIQQPESRMKKGIAVRILTLSFVGDEVTSINLC
jgi:hypothetical protein